MPFAEQHLDLASLEKVILSRNGKPEGREIRFLCPAHLDTHPSARWSPRKQVWVCDACKAGGGAWDLAKRLGVELRCRVGHAAPLTQAYPYEDEDGRLLFEVVRCDPLHTGRKSFRIRRPDGKGGWIYRLNGVPRVLFRLPQVNRAVEQGRPVWVVEGEKDVLTAESLGLVATTNPNGAGSWRESHSKALRGAAIFLVPDNDEAGWRHVEAVGRSLEGVSSDARVVILPDLPPGGDLTDFVIGLEARGCDRPAIVAELEGLAAVAPTWSEVKSRRASLAQSGIRRLSEVEPEQVSFLWQPYIPNRKLTILEGDPGQGKSWLVTALVTAGSLGSGLPSMGGFAPFRSLIFTVEDGLGDTLRPRLDAMAADCSMVFGYDQPIDLSCETGLKEVEQAITELRPKLVVFDPIVSYVGARTDTHRANEVRSLLTPLAKLAERFDCAILAVRHLSKVKGSRDIYAGQGSIDFTATARSVILVGSAADSPQQRALVHLKSNLAVLGQSLAFEIRDGRFLWAGESSLTARDLFASPPFELHTGAESEARAFLHDVLASGPVPAKEVLEAARQLGINEKTLRRAKSKVRVRVRREGFGGSGGWIWSIPASEMPS